MRSGSVIVRAAALLLLVAATGYALRVTLLPLRCERAASLGAAALQASEQKSDYAKRRVAESVRADLRGCECVSPPDVEVFFTLAGASSALGDARATVAYCRRALAIERRPEIYFALGLAQLDALDRPGAIDSLTRACAFDPKRLADIPYDDVREETKRRIAMTQGADWLH